MSVLTCPRPTCQLAQHLPRLGEGDPVVPGSWQTEIRGTPTEGIMVSMLLNPLVRNSDPRDKGPVLNLPSGLRASTGPRVTEGAELLWGPGFQHRCAWYTQLLRASANSWV